MAQIQKGDTFTNGQQVDATRLNQLVDSSVLLVGAITEQTTMTANTVESTDQTIINDGGLLKKTTIGSLLNSNLPITTSAINGVTGSDIVVAPASGQKFDVNGAFEAESINATGAMTVAGPASFNTNTAVKIPVGTTTERPATPVAGQLRYNSTLDQAEVYSGTEWKAVGGSPFDASGGLVTTVDGFKIHTFNISGTFTPALNAEGKIEYLVVGAGGAGAYYNPHGGGGGGGDVKTGFLFIAKNTSPMAVTVGSGASGTGTSSSFSTITANGGGAGSGYSGGTSGSGLAGTNGNFSSGGGGGGGARTASAYMFLGGGVGGEGFGSSISGTLKKYGGGGGGAGSNYSGSSNYPGLGLDGGGRGADSGTPASSPTANSGAGGGGGNGRNGTANTVGADGVVIIRYRVS